MLPHIDPSIPVVGVCNISETFFEFLNRAPSPADRMRLIKGEQYRGDRAIVWFGDGKLVFTTFPIPHAPYLLDQFGYRQTRYLAPSQPSAWLSLDILREQPLLDALLEYAGPARAIQLIPYATTPEFLQLAATLREVHGLTVLLPETPEPHNVWLRDYVDTKVGFRVLASRWLPNAAELLPDGIPCHTAERAADAAFWFVQRGQPCVVKADTGENGIGNRIIRPGEFTSPETILNLIRAYPFIGTMWITVEQFVEAEHPLSPSLEVFVPPLGAGEPYITYLSDQLFHDFGDFVGVLVSRELTEQSWYPPLAESGLIIARELQRMGYVGHFDLDCVVDDDGRLYLLEVNPRRTGGTHVHEFARFAFGADYLDRVALLSNDAMSSGPIRSVEDLRAAVGPLLYPIDGQPRGVIITITSALEAGEFGCIVVAPTAAETVALQGQLAARVPPA